MRGTRRRIPGHYIYYDWTKDYKDMKCSKNFPKVSPQEFAKAREELRTRRSKPGYKEGYEQGYKNGYKKGKKEGYDEGNRAADNFNWGLYH